MSLRRPYLLLGLLVACHRGPAADAPGALAPIDHLELGPHFGAARAILAHRPPPAAPASPGPGDRVFLTAWVPGSTPVRATGLGPTLIDSVTGAARALAEAAVPATARLELEAVTSVRPEPLDKLGAEKIAAVGLSGDGASDGDGRAGWVLPEQELLDPDLRSRDGDGPTDALLGAIAAAARVPREAVAEMQGFRFTTDAYLEAATPGAPPVHLVRGMPKRPPSMTPTELLAAVRAAADYLASAIDDQGVFTYTYDPITGSTNRTINVLRDAGAVYALMEAYGELRVPRWRERATLAIGALRRSLGLSSGGALLFQDPSQEQRAVGVGGLALIALVQYAAATGDAGELPLMRELARSIVRRQYPDGHFRDNADVRSEDADAPEDLKTEIYYYAGEATLALVRLYQIDPDPAWLAAARRAADYLVHVRDARDDLEHQIQDHWLSYALHDLYVLTGDPAYAAHAHKIAQAIFLSYRAPPPAPDFAGAFGPKGEATRTSVRLEALASTFQLTRFMAGSSGSDETELREVALQLACYVRGHQFDADSTYAAQDPQRALGGVRQSLLSNQIRIDYPQHALSGWLRLARLLRDPSWGAAPAKAASAPARSAR